MILNNKYKFISKSRPQLEPQKKKKKEDEETEVRFEEHKIFVINTSNQINSSIIMPETFRQISMPIIKSEIQARLKTQFKEFLDSNKNIKYFKMNENTKMLLRSFYSHEIDYLPKNLSFTDRMAGKLIGIILGIKIILDDSLEDRQIKPLSVKKTKQENRLNKMKFLFN